MNDFNYVALHFEEILDKYSNFENCGKRSILLIRDLLLASENTPRSKKLLSQSISRTLRNLPEFISAGLSMAIEKNARSRHRHGLN
jgi:hypothetical protein